MQNNEPSNPWPKGYGGVSSSLGTPETPASRLFSEISGHKGCTGVSMIKNDDGQVTGLEVCIVHETSPVVNQLPAVFEGLPVSVKVSGPHLRIRASKNDRKR